MVAAGAVQQHSSEITVSFLGIHKWEPDIYIGFSPALHLQCRWLDEYSLIKSNELKLENAGGEDHQVGGRPQDSGQDVWCKTEVGRHQDLCGGQTGTMIKKKIKFS